MESPTDRFDKLNLIRESGALFANDYYHSFLPGIEDLLRNSRDKRYYTSPIKHLELQLELLSAIADVEQVASKGRKLGHTTNDEAIKLQSRRNKLISKAYRQIADGIAWRTLGFSRFTIRVLSQAHSPGAAWGKDVGRNRELQYAHGTVSSGKYVLVHDATNSLRVGDLSSVTSIPSNKPHLAEIKNNELITAGTVIAKRLKKMKTDKQEMRLYQAQEVIDTRMFYMDSNIPVVNIFPANIDHMNGASATMKKAVRDGVASRMLAPYMYIEAIDISTLMKDRNYKEKLSSLQRPPMEILFQQSNYDYLQLLRNEELARNVPPYSIFPLPLGVTARLMTGELYITATIFEEPLRTAFDKYGWELSIDKQVLEEYESFNAADRVKFFSNEILFPDDTAQPEWMHIKNKQTGFICPVSMMIARMPHEFTSVKHIVSVAQEVMGHCTPGEDNLIYPDVIDSKRWL